MIGVLDCPKNTAGCDTFFMNMNLRVAEENASVSDFSSKLLSKRGREPDLGFESHKSFRTHYSPTGCDDVDFIPSVAKVVGSPTSVAGNPPRANPFFPQSTSMRGNNNFGRGRTQAQGTTFAPGSNLLRKRDLGSLSGEELDNTKHHRSNDLVLMSNPPPEDDEYAFIGPPTFFTGQPTPLDDKDLVSRYFSSTRNFGGNSNSTEPLVLRGYQNNSFHAASEVEDLSDGRNCLALVVYDRNRNRSMAPQEYTVTEIDDAEYFDNGMESEMFPIDNEDLSNSGYYEYPAVEEFSSDDMEM